LQDGPDGKGERRVKVVAKEDPEGMRSITLVKVARRFDAGAPGKPDETKRESRPVKPAGGYTLLEVTIKTGRTHQIRVHLSASGHAILGDDKYGDFEINKSLQKQGLKRMFLHAWRLQFSHPSTGERIELKADLAAELEKFLEHLAPHQS
jgi:23S rRNA pseudouridine955/2504/2580 synthase